MRVDNKDDMCTHVNNVTPSSRDESHILVSPDSHSFVTYMSPSDNVLPLCSRSNLIDISALIVHEYIDDVSSQTQ